MQDNFKKEKGRAFIGGLISGIAFTSAIFFSYLLL